MMYFTEEVHPINLGERVTWIQLVGQLKGQTQLLTYVEHKKPLF